MDLLRAIVLGIVQGLTEFLPVSSSGHLILIPRLFNWPDQGQAFDVGLHVGTLLALLAYFWRDWYVMFGAGIRDLFSHGPRPSRWQRESRLLWTIAAGSVPAGIAGVILNTWFEDNVRQPWLIAITLTAAGVVMLVAERVGRRERSIEGITLVDGILLGCAQAIALIPGVSRSGITISAGLFRGLDRDAAARFAFLLGTPAFVGAAILKAPDLAGSSGQEWVNLGAGFVASLVVGLAAITWLLRFIRTRSLLPFVYYRFGVAAITLIVAAVRVT